MYIIEFHNKQLLNIETNNIFYMYRKDYLYQIDISGHDLFFYFDYDEHDILKLHKLCFLKGIEISNFKERYITNYVINVFKFTMCHEDNICHLRDILNLVTEYEWKVVS